MTQEEPFVLAVDGGSSRVPTVVLGGVDRPAREEEQIAWQTSQIVS